MLRFVIENKKVYTNMKTENLKEFIAQLRGHAKNQEMNALLDHFEAFINLTEKKDEPGFQQEIETARNQCFTSIEKTLISFGLTPETMQQYFENPSNFSADEWQKVEGLKEEYLGKIEPAMNKKLKPQLGRV